MRVELRDLKHHKTPFYVYDMELLSNTVQRAKMEAEAFGFHIHYAFKANANEEILRCVKSASFGADCVSGNEVKRAIELGFNPSSVVLAGVGKTDDEIRCAISHGIFSLNCESLEELSVVQTIASEMNRAVSVALRINPNVDAKTHKYISTGRKEDKFGLPESDLLEALAMLDQCEHTSFKGLHFHIGSQILDLAPFIGLCNKVNELHAKLLNMGVPIGHVNLGGGLGINYLNPDIEPIPNFKLFFETIKSHLKVGDTPVHFELGRSLVGQCGALVTRVLYQKQAEEVNFLIVDAGMTDLMRPALYEARHQIDKVTESRESVDHQYHVVGPVCESTDSFGSKVDLPKTQRGDFLMIKSAGAYGECMANNYNLRERSPAVFLNNIFKV